MSISLFFNIVMGDKRLLVMYMFIRMWWIFGESLKWDSFVDNVELM